MQLLLNHNYLIGTNHLENIKTLKKIDSIIRSAPLVEQKAPGAYAYQTLGLCVPILEKRIYTGEDPQ